MDPLLVDEAGVGTFGAPDLHLIVTGVMGVGIVVPCLFLVLGLGFLAVASIVDVGDVLDYLLGGFDGDLLVNFPGGD